MVRHFKRREKYTFQSLDSTNNFAAKLLSDANPEEGTVILAEFQTAGKGQRGKNWEATAGKNLLTSVILRPTFLSVERHALLNKAVALAVFDTVKEFCETAQVHIKWPNDILVNGLKIAGILIENVVKFGQIESSIVGVGVNVLQTSFDEAKATSLALESNRLIPVEVVCDSLLKNLEKRYSDLQERNFPSLRSSYREHLFGLGKKKAFVYRNLEVDAIIKGVTPEGKLILEMESGEEVLCSNGEVVYLS
jgi:BirA family biotin operon repressor/biotin-[acetyl-CoA-carboxylase] ligase